MKHILDFFVFAPLFASYFLNYLNTLLHFSQFVNLALALESVLKLVYLL